MPAPAGHVQVGRLAMREEGSNWVAYYALKETMDGAIYLGSIRMGAITANSERKQAFMDMMRDIVSDLIEEQTGVRPQWGGAARAPEHERSGNA